MGETQRTLSLSMSGEGARIALPPSVSSNGEVDGSKADFRGLIADLRDPVIILNRLGRICFTNPAAKAFFKHGLGTRVEEYLNKHHSKTAQTQVRFHLTTGADVILKISRHHIQWIGKPSVLVSLQNITQYVKAAAKMRDSNLRSVSLLERVTDASFIVDVGERTSAPYLSPQFDTLLGNERSSWNSDPELWRRFIHDDDRAKVIEKVAKAIHERKPFAAEYRMHTGNGNVIWVREKAQVTDDLEAGLVILSGFLADITQERGAATLAATTVESPSDQEHLTQLEQALAASRKAQTALQEERDQLDDFLTKRSAKLSALQESLTQQTAETRQAHDATQQLQMRLTELEIASEELHEGRDELEKQLTQRSSDIERINEHLVTETASREQAEARAEDLQRNLAEAERITAELKTKHERVVAERDHHAAELAAASEGMAQQTAEHEEAMASRNALQRRLAEAERIAEELKAEHDRVVAERDRHAAELAAASEGMAQQMAEHEEAMASGNALQQRLAELEAAAEELKSSRSELDERLRQSARDLEQINEKLSAEATQRQQAEERAVELQQHLVETNQAMEGLRAERGEIEAAKDERIAKLEQIREGLQQELAVSAQGIEDLETSQRHLKDQWNQRAAELKKTVDDLRQEVDEARRAAGEAESARVSLAEEMSHQTAESEKTRSQLEQDLAESESVAKRANASCEKFEAELRQHRKDLKKAQRELSLRTDAAQRTEQTLCEYRTRFEDWAKKSVAELLVASEHLRHELTEEAQAGNPPE